MVCEVLKYAAGKSLDRLDIVPTCQRMVRGARLPAFTAAVIAPLVLASAGGAASRSPAHMLAVRDTAVVPMAAVTVTDGDLLGPAIVAAARPPATVRIAPAPPPTVTVKHVDAPGIPPIALSAYRNAEQMTAVSSPECGLSWSLLAGIGRIESMHANGGATDVRGTAVDPIYGPVLNGTLPGNEIIVESSSAGEITYVRAVGPMQFLPRTWARYASDGDGDGVADPQNLYDSSLAAARYLCSGGQDLREPLQVIAAVMRYNNSMPYVRNVLGWADAYAAGVVPIGLPEPTGSAPPLVDLHLANPEGLGPGLPLNIDDVLTTDLVARTPLIDLGSSDSSENSGSTEAAPDSVVLVADAEASDQQNAEPFSSRAAG